MKVLVTGASGFLGREVVKQFRRRGHDVRAMVRPNTDASKLPWHSSAVEVVHADLRGGSDLRDAIDGVDAVVHLAAAVTGGEYGQFVAAVRGTERLLEAMVRTTSVRRLILASSFSVYDWSEIRGDFSEESPIERDLYDRDGYAVAKVWQERVARRMCDEHGIALTVLRPGFLWGRGNEYCFGLGQKVGRAHLLFGPTRRLPLSHVHNCADCFVSATEGPAAIGQTFNVVDDDLPSVWRYAGAYVRSTGNRTWRIPVPYRLAKLVTHLAKLTSNRLFNGNGKLPSILVPCRFEARFKPVRFSNAKLYDVLGWRPPLDFERCLVLTFGAPEAYDEHDEQAVDEDMVAIGELANA